MSETKIQINGASTPAEQCRRWAEEINADFEQANVLFVQGSTRAIGTGARLNYVKEEGKRTGAIPHGKFGPWLAKHCPAICWNTAGRWMALATSAATVLQIPHNGEFDPTGHLSLAKAAAGCSELSKDEQLLREKLLALVSGKSQKQLFLEFKSAEKDPVSGEIRVLDPKGGGDRTWSKFIAEKHPALMKDGEAPKRTQVPSAVRREFDAHWAQTVREARSPEIRERETRREFEYWHKFTAQILANKDLALLAAGAFTGPLATLELLRKRFQDLQGRAPRKRKPKANPANGNGKVYGKVHGLDRPSPLRALLDSHRAEKGLPPLRFDPATGLAIKDEVK